MREVVDRVLAGDQDAYREIVREYGPMVRVLLAAHLRDHHLIEDLSQEVFVAAFWGLKNYDPARDFRAWLGGIARHKLLSHLRMRYSQKNSVHTLTVEIHELLADDFEQYNPDTETVMERLRACIAKHSAEDRRLIEARYFRNESVTDIAAWLHTTVSAVSSQLYRIRGQLRRCIEREVPL